MRLIAAAAVALLLGMGATKADPLPVRLGWSVMPSEPAPVLFTVPGLAKHKDVTYTFEPVHITASPQMIQAIAANEIDIAAFAFSSFPLAVQNAGMTDLRVIADEIQDGVPGYYTDEFKVRKDGGIAKVEDLKGKVLATTGFGAASDIALRAMLVSHGLNPTKDVTIIQGAYANMPALLAERKADLVASVPPFSFEPGLNTIATTLFTGKDAMGRTDKIFWAAPLRFLTKNRPAHVDFMEDYLRAMRWLIDPANATQATAIYSNFTKVPQDFYLTHLYKKEETYYHDRDALPDLDALQHSIDVQLQLGFLKAPIDIKAMSDLSMIKEAAARLR